MHDCDVHETIYPVKFMAPGFQVGASHMVKIKHPSLLYILFGLINLNFTPIL